MGILDLRCDCNTGRGSEMIDPAHGRTPHASRMPMPIRQRVTGRIVCQLLLAHRTIRGVRSHSRISGTKSLIGNWFCAIFTFPRKRKLAALLSYPNTKDATLSTLAGWPRISLQTAVDKGFASVRIELVVSKPMDSLHGVGY